LLTLSHPHATLDHRSEHCRAVSEILSRIGDKWTVLVVELLGRGPTRFNELRREIGGISQKMLTTTLRQLERDGMVTRTVYPTIPPRVDYELTALGRELLVPVHALGAWARANMDRIDEARRRYDEQAAA
jgi:DNA-binding HxlR family transcriptional regulator